MSRLKRPLSLLDRIVSFLLGLVRLLIMKGVRFRLVFFCHFVVFVSIVVVVVVVLLLLGCFVGGAQATNSQ